MIVIAKFPTLWRFKPHTNPRITAMNWSIERGNISGAPDILQLGVGEGPRVKLTREWQLFMSAINPNVPVEKVVAFLGNAVAFTNKTGFGETPYQNWLENDNTTSTNPDGSPMLPEFDKVRTCAYAVHRGVLDGDEVVLDVLDGNQRPPDVGTINPESTPWYFFHATIVWVDSNGIERRRGPFAQNAPGWGYSYGITIMPLVSCYPIRVPLDMVVPAREWTPPYYKYP